MWVRNAPAAHFEPTTPIIEMIQMEAKMKNKTLLLTILIVSAFLLNACGSFGIQIEQQSPLMPVTQVASATQVAPATQAETAEITASPTSTSAPATNSLSFNSGAVGPITASFDPAVAASASAGDRPATPATSGGPYWEALPQHAEITLNGYPVAGHQFQPQIFIYPVDEFKALNEAAGQVIADLETLLQNRPVEQQLDAAGGTSTPSQVLPFLPLQNAQQLIHAQMKYLDFKNGQGVRFVTQYDQFAAAINNHEAFYAFQGLTSDGKYYLAAILPINLASLPDGNVIPSGMEPTSYYQNMYQQLDNAPSASYTPGLDKLDELMASFEIK
jgi:hypothetical protein